MNNENAKNSPASAQMSVQESTQMSAGKVKIGQIMDAHGIRGEIGVVVDSGDVSWINKVRSLYIPRKNVFEEHQINKIRAHKKGFICHLENFTDRNKAEQYKGREVWVDENLFVSEEGESLYLSEILHFEVEDRQLGVLGQVINFSTNGMQDLLVVKCRRTHAAQSEKATPKSDSESNSNSEEVEIPFVKEFVDEIDFETQKIKMNLPEGLLQINDKE